MCVCVCVCVCVVCVEMDVKCAGMECVVFDHDIKLCRHISSYESSL